MAPIAPSHPKVCLLVNLIFIAIVADSAYEDRKPNTNNA